MTIQRLSRLQISKINGLSFYQYSRGICDFLLLAIQFRLP